MSVELAWLVTIIGLVGFWLAGNKVWWAWYVNVANQVLWVIFALVSGYYAFLLGASFYTFVFVKNAIQWTREHFLAEAIRKELAGAIVKEAESVLLYGNGEDVEIKDDYYDEGK